MKRELILNLEVLKYCSVHFQQFCDFSANFGQSDGNMKPRQHLSSNWVSKTAVRKKGMIEVFIERKLEELFFNEAEDTKKS